MLDIRYISANKELVIRGLQKRYFKNAAETVDRLLAIDQQRRATQVSLDHTTAQLNQLTKQIGQLIHAQEIREADAIKTQTTALKLASKQLTQQLQMYEETLQ